MLWLIIALAVVSGVISAFLRRKSSFDVSNEHERQIQEEDRVKASSWFDGGGQ